MKFMNNIVSAYNKVFKYNPLFVMFIFLFIYLPPIFKINILFILDGISIIYLVLKFKDLKNLIKMMFEAKIFPYHIAMLLSLIYLTILLPLHGNMIKPVYGIFLVVIAIPISSIFILNYFVVKKYDIIDVLNILLIVGSIQGIISILTLLIPSLKLFFINIFLTRGYPKVFMSMKWRVFGFSTGLTYAMPIVQAFLAVCALYLALNKSYKYLCYVPILLLSSFINARIGIVIFTVGLIILVLFSFEKNNRKTNLKVLIILGSLFAIFFIGLILLSKISPKTISWILDFFKVIRDLFRGKATGFFKDMFITTGFPIPKGKTFLIGIGHTVSGGFRGVRSDCGYINDLWLCGIFFAITIWTAMSYYLLLNFKRTKSITSFISIFAFATFLLSNFKGMYFSFNEVFALFSMLLPFISIKNIEKQDI